MGAAVALLALVGLIAGPAVKQARRSLALGRRSPLLASAASMATLDSRSIRLGSGGADATSSTTPGSSAGTQAGAEGSAAPSLAQAAYRTLVTIPGPAQIAAARRYAASRQGVVSFAVIGTDGRMSGYRQNRQYVSASVVKAMLLVAYLRSHPTLSGTAKAQLSNMIRFSDNDAADWTQNAVGNDALYRVAKLAKMRDFSVRGHWTSAQLTPADQARFFLNMDALIPKQHRAFARKLLSTITASQSWGDRQGGSCGGLGRVLQGRLEGHVARAARSPVGAPRAGRPGDRDRGHDRRQPEHGLWNCHDSGCSREAPRFHEVVPPRRHRRRPPTFQLARPSIRPHVLPLAYANSRPEGDETLSAVA